MSCTSSTCTDILSLPPGARFKISRPSDILLGDGRGSVYLYCAMCNLAVRTLLHVCVIFVHLILFMRFIRFMLPSFHYCTIHLQICTPGANSTVFCTTFAEAQNLIQKYYTHLYSKHLLSIQQIVLLAHFCSSAEITSISVIESFHLTFTISRPCLDLQLLAILYIRPKAAGKQS